MWEANQWTKVAFIIVFFIEAIACGLLPVKIRKFKESPDALGVANAFAGGVFLAIALLHILPEEVESFQQYNSSFPLPYLILVIGYLIILIIDRVLFDTHSILDDKHQGGHGLLDDGPNLKENQEDLRSPALSRSEVFAAKVSKYRRSSESRQDIESQSIELPNRNQQIQERDSLLISKSRKPSYIQNMTPIILLIGLGVHAIFEGLSLGMSKDLKSTVIFAIAIILHKGAAGMSLGISLVKTFPDEDQFITWLLILFAIFTPAGVILGWLLENSSPMTEIVFSCLASGSFLYIACSEVIVQEFSNPKYRYLKLFLFIVGIAVITSLKLLEMAGQ